ncbi:hypothetical protein MMPV_005622 [Pyropia vietnamensis]
MKGLATTTAVALAAMTVAVALLPPSVSCTHEAVRTRQEPSWGPPRHTPPPRPSPPGTHFHSIAYAPFQGSPGRTCPPFRPADGGDFCLPPEVVAADMARLRSLTPRVRTYSAVCDVANRVIYDSARAGGMTIDAGVWVGHDAAAVEREIQLLAAVLADGYGDVIRTIWVGNEATSIHGVSVGTVTAVVRRVRAAISAAAVAAAVAGRAPPPSPRVGVTEIGAHWLAAKPGTPAATLARSLDVLGVQEHPYYAGADPLAADVSGIVLDRVAAVAAAHPGVEVTLSETGFPTRGAPWRAPPGGGNTTATPSVAAAAAYAKQVEAAAARAGVGATWIGLADDEWKRRWAPSPFPGGADYAWGLLDCARRDKGGGLPPPARWA